jgi:putative ATP-dependent endonuclease of OLD family
MIIKSIEVKNFRSIRESRLDCDSLTAILGRNGAGKSSFLKAIDIFYDIASPITEEDFFDRDIHANIEIRLSYGDLRDDEKQEFKTYVTGDSLIVTKRISFENDRPVQRYYAAALQIPQFAKIRSIPGKKDRVAAWKQLSESSELSDLDGKVRSADDVEKLMTEYENIHPELMQPVEREEQFFGPKNIGGGKLDKFTKFVLIPAVREASDEVSGRKGAIYHILDMIVLRRINAREDIRKFKDEFEERVSQLYSSENLTELPELGNSISQTLEKFAPGSKLNLGWDQVKTPEIQMPSARATLIEDNFEGEITHKGHGLQRALIVTLLQHLAMTVPIEIPSPDEKQPREEEKSEIQDYETYRGPDLILGIEEPELYLHPSRCRYLANLLIQLVERPGEGLGASNQIIYTSHSPYFVDLQRFDQVRIIRKIPSPDSSVLQSIVTRFSLAEASKNIAKICDSDPESFTRDSFRARALPVINTIVNEGFFADVVVIVEGQSEVGVLWKLQEILNKDWSQLGIALVPAGGKNNIDRPVVIFRGLNIPTYFIFDADSRFKEKGKKEEKETKNRNYRYLRLAGVSIEDFPDTQIHDTWTVFKDNLEEICRESLGSEVYHKIREEVASEFGYENRDQACKNLEGASRFIELVYEKGYSIHPLEKVVQMITKLRDLDSVAD